MSSMKEILLATVVLKMLVGFDQLARDWEVFTVISLSCYSPPFIR